MSDYVHESYTYGHISKRISYTWADLYLSNKGLGQIDRLSCLGKEVTLDDNLRVNIEKNNNSTLKKLCLL